MYKQSILVLLTLAASSRLSAMHREIKNEYIVQQAQSPYEEIKSYEILAQQWTENPKDLSHSWAYNLLNFGPGILVYKTLGQNEQFNGLLVKLDGTRIELDNQLELELLWFKLQNKYQSQNNN